LIVRSNQMKAFQTQADETFIQSISDFLREEHAQAVVQIPIGSFNISQIPEDLFFEMIRNSLERARNYELDMESSLVSFVTLMFVVAPNFDWHIPFKIALENNEIEPNLRIDRLITCSTERDWEVAVANYEISEWKFKTTTQS